MQSPPWFCGCFVSNDGLDKCLRLCQSRSRIVDAQPTPKICPPSSAEDLRCHARFGREDLVGLFAPPGRTLGPAERLYPAPTSVEALRLPQPDGLCLLVDDRALPGGAGLGVGRRLQPSGLTLPLHPPGLGVSLAMPGMGDGAQSAVSSGLADPVAETLLASLDS